MIVYAENQGTSLPVNILNSTRGSENVTRTTSRHQRVRARERGHRGNANNVCKRFRSNNSHATLEHGEQLSGERASVSANVGKH